MRILVPIHPSIKSPEAIARLCRAYMGGVVAENRILMRMAAKEGRPVPDLYESGIKFRAEPWAGRLDEFCDCLTLLQRGWGDCEDLVIYRVAQLKERGGKYAKSGVKIYWRQTMVEGKRQTIYHAQVREWDGKIDDPSRRLGG